MRSRAHALLSRDRRRAEAGEDEQPEEQGPLLTSPERGQRVRRRQCSARRPRDVLKGEVVAQERRDEYTGSYRRRRERGDQRVLGGAREAPATDVRRVRPRDERVRGQAECDEERGATQLRHGLASGRVAARLRRVLRRALRDQRARFGDERAALEPPLDHDVAADLEEVRNRARVPHGYRGGRFEPMSLSPKRRPPACASPRTGPTTTPASCTVPVRPASSLGANDGFPPPAIEVYSRKTASTAATESAMTRRAGLPPARWARARSVPRATGGV